MSWRTVVITKQSKLDFKMNYMIVRQGFDVKKVFIDEIYMVIIESTAVSLIAVLLNALVKAKVKLCFQKVSISEWLYYVTRIGVCEVGIKYNKC